MSKTRTEACKVRAGDFRYNYLKAKSATDQQN